MPFEVFISYAHEDKELRKKLDKHLAILQRRNVINSWSDSDIKPGTLWRQQIDAHLKSAQIFLFLISADFIASEFCYSIEMDQALKRHQANEARVIPVLLRPVYYEGAPFAELQMLPEGAKPVTSWSNVDEAFAGVAKGIEEAVNDLKSKGGTVK
jgi:hypothetical protein